MSRGLMCALAPLALTIAASTVTGCTTVSALRSSTIAQGQTATDIVNSMVLDNMAMSLKEGKALPWHVKITQGSIGMSDSINPSLSYTWPTIARSLGLSGSRGWSLTWTIVPELDGTKLNDLEDLYYSKTHPLDSSVFGHGTSAPKDVPHGRYRDMYVWVNDGHMGDFAELVRQVLLKAPVTPAERGIQLPVPAH